MRPRMAGGIVAIRPDRQHNEGEHHEAEHRQPERIARPRIRRPHREKVIRLVHCTFNLQPDGIAETRQPAIR